MEGGWVLLEDTPMPAVSRPKGTICPRFLQARETYLCCATVSRHYRATSSVFRDLTPLFSGLALCLEVTESHLQPSPSPQPGVGIHHEPTRQTQETGGN